LNTVYHTKGNYLKEIKFMLHKIKDFNKIMKSFEWCFLLLHENIICLVRKRLNFIFNFQLHRCDMDDMCGHVRADLFSAYYHCSCPKGSLCVSRGQEAAKNVTEMLFLGLAYHAYCTPYPHINRIN
jgi:hypothetical protein